MTKKLKLLTGIFLVSSLLSLSACQKDSSTAKSSSEVITENSQNGYAIDEETDSELTVTTVKEKYIPYDVLLSDSYQLGHLPYDYQAPENIGDFVGYYEGIVNKSDESVTTVLLSITDEGYYTLYEYRIGKAHGEKRHLDKNGVYASAESYGDVLGMSTGVVTQEYNKLKLWKLVELSNNWRVGTLEWEYDEEGNQRGLLFGGGKLKKDHYGKEAENYSNKYFAGIPVFVADYSRLSKSETIFLNTSNQLVATVSMSDSESLVYKDERSSVINEELKRVDSVPSIIEKSVFQQFYDWLENYGIEFNNKNDFYQFLRARFVDFTYDSEKEEELMTKQGYLESGEKLNVKYIIQSQDVVSDLYGYDGQKIYRGKYNKSHDVIEWSEFEDVVQQAHEYYQSWQE